MKQKSIFLSWLTIMMVAMLSVGFAACDNDDDDDDSSSSTYISESQLIGTWRISASDDVVAENITFYENHQYKTDDMEGTCAWELDDNTIILDYYIRLKIKKYTKNKITADWTNLRYPNLHSDVTLTKVN